MIEPWTVAQTWTLIGLLMAGIGVPAGLVLRWQRRNETPAERQWRVEGWFLYGRHYDDEGEAPEPGDVT